MTTATSRSKLRKLPVGPGFIDPSCYEIDADGCWIWRHAVLGNGVGVTPIVSREYRHINVRRLYVTDLAPNERIALSCGKNRCVNPAHYLIYQTARVYRHGYRAENGNNVIQADGSLHPRAYERLPNGCVRWLLNGAGKPGHRLEVSVNGKVTDVRRYLAPGLPKYAKITLTCDEPDCINPAHFAFAPKTRQKTAERTVRMAERRRAALDAPVWETRGVAYVRDDLKTMMEEAGGAQFPERSWTAAWRFANGMTLQAIAEPLGITPQGVLSMIQTLDRRLRLIGAGCPLKPRGRPQ